MKTIKFRSYIKDKKLEPIMVYFDLTTDNRWIIEKKSPIMMFTGLSDKHGKEVYEGDIVETDEGRYEILWDIERAKFTLGDDSMVLAFGTVWQPKHFEIVGNIYESPNPPHMGERRV